MSREFIAAQRLSKVRWYFGVVGLVGLVGAAVVLDTPQAPTAHRAMAALAVPLTLAYLGAAVAFPRLCPGPWLARIAGGMVVWGLALAVLIGLRATPRQAIPVVLFVIVPAASVVITAPELRQLGRKQGR